MANLQETSTWEAGIYQLETSDPVMGGENGIDNRAPRQLANRTLWLKNELARQIDLVNQNNTNLTNQKADKTVQFTAGNGLTGGGDLSTARSIALGTPSKITANSTNVAVSNTHSHEIDKASTSTAGIVQLNNSLTSTSQTQALTANMGKVLKDEINAISADKMTLRGTLDTTDLNTLNATDSTGIWHQTHDANATTARSYPVSQAGTLWVLPAAYTGQQIYIPYSQDTIYKRTSTRTGGWESWQSFNATLPTQTHGLVTATAATGTVNTPTNNNNTFLNIVTNTAGQTSSTGSSTQITGANGVGVSSNTQGSLIIAGVRATDTAAGVTQLSHATNGTDKTKAASEYALGEVRRMANQAQVTADGIALTWNNIQNKPNTVQDYAISNAMRTDADSTTTGIIKINRLASYLQGLKNGSTDSWYVGSGSSYNDDVQLFSQIHNTKIDLKATTIEVNKPLYYNGNKVYHAGNLPATPTATTTTAGIVQLNNSLTSISQTQALTANIGKLLNDIKLDRTQNAASASKLATPRRIALTGAVTGNVNFDGSSNVSMTTAFDLSHFASNKTQNGYQKLPSGLILQWGDAQTYQTTIFPITFPSSITCLVVTPKSTSLIAAFATSHVTNRGFRIFTSAGQSSSGIEGFYWFAIGY